MDDIHTKKIDEIDGILYHYTAVEGLLGIINSNRIYATSFPFLNDSSEIVYGRRLVRNILVKKIEKEKDKQVKTLYEELLKLNGIDKKRIYITCFCEKGNLLSQWRGYAKGGLGFSVGLDVTMLKREYRDVPYDEVYIKKVVYDLSTQTRLINKYLDEAVQHIKEKNVTLDREIRKIAKLTDWEVDKNAAFFKDRAFEEEKEWRAIYCGNSHGDTIETKYRARSNRIVDYKEFSFAPTKLLDNKYREKLPLKKIICGPGIEHEATIEVIKNLLKDRGYDYTNIEIDHSSIPFKNI